jgi:iduronate 2-sulfatase
MRTLSALLLLAGAAAAADKPNVLFIVSDDLANVQGCYGHTVCRTPNIDALAAKGVRFDRAYCQFPLCNPSRASFLTGLRPDTLKVYENATQFRKNVPDAVSLPQTFQKAGYTAIRVGKLYHYGVPAQIGTDGLDDAQSWNKVINPKGFDKDDEDANRIFTLNPMGKGSGRYGGTLSWLASEGKDEEMTDGKIAAEVVGQLAANKGKPFFLACGFFRPHTPYVAPKKYFDMYPADKIVLPKVPANAHDDAPAAAFGSAKPEQAKLTDELRKQAIQAYFASVSFMDAQVGLVVEALEKNKLAENTIIVFMSDHGYHLGEHGLWQKMSLWENSARVPLIVVDPRAKGNGKACARTVEIVDLHATLAEVAGLPAPKTDGKSLKPLLDDPGVKWGRPAITQVSRGTPTMTGETTPKGQQWFLGYSARTEEFRYTEWDGGKKGVQLYDMQADPKQEKNLANDPKYADTVKAMKTMLPVK